jgi:glycosyltransferase involved in cell wall biosynthesis
MRVLFLSDLSDPSIGSSVRQIYQLAEELRRLGHETALVTAVQDPALATPTEVLGLETFRLHSDYNVRFRAWVALDNPRVREPLRAVLESWKPDVVHAHLIHTHLSYAALGAARRAGAAVVFTAHDVMSFCQQKLTCFHGGAEGKGELRDYRAYWQKCLPCQRLRYNPWRNRAIRRVLARDVHRLTVVSDELGLALAANGIRVDRTVHNAIRPHAAPPTPEAVLDFARRHGLEGAQVVTIAGRLHEQKGVAQLFAMVARLAPELPRLRLLLLGHRQVYEREFAGLARQLGIEGRIVAPGWLDGDELARAWGATDVLVTPSICFDTFGLVNLEAMEHAKPVVATSFGGSPEVVEHGVTGFVENPFDLENFGRRIRALLEDPKLARRLGEAGYLRMRQHFTIERLTAEFLEEYSAALEVARAGPRRAEPAGAQSLSAGAADVDRGLGSPSIGPKPFR